MDPIEVLTVSELADRMSGRIEEVPTVVTPTTSASAWMPTLIADEYLATVERSGNRHTVTAGPKFPDQDVV